MTGATFHQRPGVASRDYREGCARGSVQMIRVVIDTVLFSCMGAFVTAIVVAVTTLLS